MNGPVHAQPGKRSHLQRAIELLARESRVPIEEVARLYEGKRAELEFGARMTSFVPIFAIRRVREMLRQRTAGMRTPA